MCGQIFEVHMWKWTRFERESWLALTEKESPDLIICWASSKGPLSVWPTSQSTRTLTSAWSVLSWSWSVYLLVTNVTGKCGDQARKERSLIHLCVTLAFAKAGLVVWGSLTAAEWWKTLPPRIGFSTSCSKHEIAIFTDSCQDMSGQFQDEWHQMTSPSRTCKLAL